MMMRTLEGYLGDARLRDGMRLYADRARFRERHHQMLLAAKRGTLHLGSGAL